MTKKIFHSQAEQTSPSHCPLWRRWLSGEPERNTFLSSRWMEAQFFHFDCFLIMGLVALTSRNLFLKEMAPNM